jgi:hypothetical protein
LRRAGRLHDAVEAATVALEVAAAPEGHRLASNDDETVVEDDRD